MILEQGSTREEKLSVGFRWLTSRPPTAKELEILKKTLEKELAIFQANKGAAEKFLAYSDLSRNQTLDPAEHAAWTMIANLIINLDESITK